MSPASGPVTDSKAFPAAIMEDQEALVEGRQEVTVLGPPPFSSPNPATEANRLAPITDDTSAHQAALDAEGERTAPDDYKSMNVDVLTALAAERDIEVEGTGKDGKVKKDDLVKALAHDDTADFKAADWKREIAEAKTTEELDAVGERYDNSDRDYPTVVAAFEARQNEIDAEDGTEDKTNE